MVPSDMIFTKGKKPQSRSITFIKDGVTPGFHTVRFQWFADGSGSIGVGDRSTVVSGMRNRFNRPTHPVAALTKHARS